MRKENILLYISNIFLLLFIYNGIIYPLLSDSMFLLRIPGKFIIVNSVFMLFFSVFHSIYLIGFLNTWLFCLITIFVSWSYEQFGVQTGLIYGSYHYTKYLGIKVGDVPILIPIAWYMMIYPSYIISNLILVGRPIVSNRGKNLSLSLVGSLVMTAWDLVLDPYLSGPTVRAWVWHAGGIYFGIPLQNFFGWILTTLTIHMMYRFYESPIIMGSKYRARKSYPLILPVLGYSAMCIVHLIPGEPKELRMIGPVIMGIPVILALRRFMRNS